MTTYEKFLEHKLKAKAQSGIEVSEKDLNKNLFDFQKYIVKKALSCGKYAIFADCGLGKTLMQIEWANQVNKFTGDPVLIMCPLAVAAQTIEEGERFGIKVNHYGEGDIQIINYDQIDNITVNQFSGVVLDESSILKNFTGETKKKLMELFGSHKFKLCCTATPSPNDDMEITNHAEFLGQGKSSEILAMYFTHDGGETQQWRLKGHARRRFWNFVKTWSCFVSNPCDLGFDGSKFILPKLNLIEVPVLSNMIDAGEGEQSSMFNDAHVSATNFNYELRRTVEKRLNKVAEIVNNSNDDWIIWIKHKSEGEYLRELINDAIEISGHDSLDRKNSLILWFTNEHNRCDQENKNCNTSKNTTEKISTDINVQESRILRETGGVEIDTQTIKNTETGQKKRQKIKEQNLDQSQDSTMISKGTMELGSKSIEKFQNNRDIDVQFVNENIHCLSKNNGSTLTIATKQTELGDYYASTAIMRSENSRMTKYCSNARLCTCGKVRRKIIISKTKILGWGINAQNCHNQIFASLDFSFEGTYQAIRRSYRFGQKKPVNIYMITTDSMANVIGAIKQKQNQFEVMKYHLTTN